MAREIRPLQPGATMEIMDLDELDQRLDALAEHPENVDKNAAPDPKDPGDEIENGPDVDPEDPNLSAVMAEAGAEDRKDELGMKDEQEKFLDDPDTMEDAED